MAATRKIDINNAIENIYSSFLDPEAASPVYLDQTSLKEKNELLEIMRSLNELNELNVSPEEYIRKATDKIKGWVASADPTFIEYLWSDPERKKNLRKLSIFENKEEKKEDKEDVEERASRMLTPSEAKRLRDDALHGEPETKRTEARDRLIALTKPIIESESAITSDEFAVVLNCALATQDLSSKTPTESELGKLQRKARIAAGDDVNVSIPHSVYLHHDIFFYKDFPFVFCNFDIAFINEFDDADLKRIWGEGWKFFRFKAAFCQAVKEYEAKKTEELSTALDVVPGWSPVLTTVVTSYLSVDFIRYYPYLENRECRVKLIPGDVRQFIHVFESIDKQIAESKKEQEILLKLLRANKDKKEEKTEKKMVIDVWMDKLWGNPNESISLSENSDGVVEYKRPNGKIYRPGRDKDINSDELCIALLRDAEDHFNYLLGWQEEPSPENSNPRKRNHHHYPFHRNTALVTLAKSVINNINRDIPFIFNFAKFGNESALTFLETNFNALNECGFIKDPERKQEELKQYKLVNYLLVNLLYKEVHEFKKEIDQCTPKTFEILISRIKQSNYLRGILGKIKNELLSLLSSTYPNKAMPGDLYKRYLALFNIHESIKNQEKAARAKPGFFHKKKDTTSATKFKNIFTIGATELKELKELKTPGKPRGTTAGGS